MSMSRSINVLAMLVLLITASAAPAIAGILAAPSCNEVTTALSPCLSFLKGNSAGDSPPPACCSGAQNLASKAKAKADQQAVCECLKGVLSKIGPYEPSRVPLIGKKCGIDIHIPPITGNTDCFKL